MAFEALILLAKLNLAAGAGVILVMLLRSAARRLVGARLAYGLWLIVPAAMLAAVAPPRVQVIEVIQPAVAVRPVSFAKPVQSPQAPATAAFFAPAAGSPPPPPEVPPAREAPDVRNLLLAVWVAGCLLLAAWFGRKQRQFMRAVRSGHGGPAVVGVFRPWIVIPDNFAAQFSPREQAVILAHEEAHIARGDSRINGLVALMRCLCWFNPLVHLGAFEMRVDQELACDAQVLEAHPKSRHAYAVAMLKAEGADRPLPLGCYWPAGTRHPLMERIAMLKLEKPSPRRRLVGLGLILTAASASAISAWAMQPPRVVETAPAAAAPAPGAAADPLGQLAQGVSVIFDVGTPHPRLMIQENDHGVSSITVLGMGEEYRDGWKLSGVTDKTVSLTKAAQTRTITLTGKVQVASSAPPPAAASPAAGPAKAGAKPATNLAEAIASGNIAEIVKFGGTAQDIARVLAAGGVRPGGATLIPESAAFMQNPAGKPGLFVLSDNGITYVAYGSDFDGYRPPNGTGTLPSIGQVIANLEVTPSPQPFIPAQTLEGAIALGYTNQVIAMGASAQDIARAYAAAGVTANGAPIDPNTAVLVRATGPVAAIGISVYSTNGGRVTLMSSDFQQYPGSRANLPSPEQVFGLPPSEALYPSQSLADAVAERDAARGVTPPPAPAAPLTGAAPVAPR